MSPANISHHVLWLAIEDYSGLWEVLWEINTRYPDLSNEQKQVAARDTVIDLLRRDWIRLYRCQEPDGEPQLLSHGENEKALLDAQNWEAPELHSISIRIGATEAGEQAYRHFAGPACDPEKAATALGILRRRDPKPTDVHLAGGRILRVFNVAWGRDIGDEYDHVTTNISPEPAVDHTVDFFYTSEITALIDPDSGAEIWP